MSSVTTIVNVVSYVLIALFLFLLLFRYHDWRDHLYPVLERKKEIGILRSIGASKRDIRRVFNAETLIVAFVAGVIGGSTVLLTIPVNAIVSARFGVEQVAQLPGSWRDPGGYQHGAHLLGGLIPSSAASRKDRLTAPEQ